MDINTLQDSEATGGYQEKWIKIQEFQITNRRMNTGLNWYTVEQTGLYRRE